MFATRCHIDRDLRDPEANPTQVTSDRSSASVHRLVLAVRRARAQSAAADGARARNRLLDSTSVKRHFQST